ncbi:MAG: SulP family inorganic anion transporter [Bacteroidia bacterium]|nr:SulP family inorganic anion transporter [Bacteroidia bacterium]
MFSHIKNDLKAGLVVFLVALPLCLGIALGQKAPLFSGIIAGVIGGIVVSAISGSKLSVSGPAAGLTSIVLSSVTQLGSFEAFLMAVCLAGVFQILLGVLKAGIIGYYFPNSVIKGMLCAIGIILIRNQIPHFVGFDNDIEVDEMDLQDNGQKNLFHLDHYIDSISYGSMIIGIVSLLILIIWHTKFIKKSKYLRQIPGALLVVVVGVLIDLFFSHQVPSLEVKDEHLVVLPQFTSISGFFGSFLHPDFSALANSKVYSVAFIIGVVASLETLLSLEAVDKLDPNNQVSPTNRELIAQGTGNLLSGLIGGLPITSVIVRSSVNVDAGAKSQLSAIVHGLLFLVAVILLPGILQLIPLSSLAAILLFTGYNLAHPVTFKRVFKQGADQFLPFIITLLVMLFSDLLMGVSVGIFVAIIFILRQNYQAPFKMVKEEIDGKMNVFMRLSQNVTFINKGKFIEVFKDIPDGSIVYIDGGRSNFVDKDVLEIISAFKSSAQLKNITVHLEDVQEVEILSNH